MEGEKIHKACCAVVQPATSGELQLPSIYMKEVLKIAIFVSRCRWCVQKLRARAVPEQKNTEAQAMETL